MALRRPPTSPFLWSGLSRQWSSSALASHSGPHSTSPRCAQLLCVNCHQALIQCLAGSCVFQSTSKLARCDVLVSVARRVHLQTLLYCALQVEACVHYSMKQLYRHAAFTVLPLVSPFPCCSVPCSWAGSQACTLQARRWPASQQGRWSCTNSRCGSSNSLQEMLAPSALCW